MGRLGLLTLLVTVIAVAALVGEVYFSLIAPHDPPQVEDEFWGLEPQTEDNIGSSEKIEPIRINISNVILTDLKERLKQELAPNKLTPPLEGSGFNFGFNTKFLKTVGSYWLNVYNWTERQQLLNKFPHFKTKIGGLEIHFQHVKPPARNGSKPRPLLLLHGWPGSFVEFQKIIPLLSESNSSKHFYELIIPSLPGYGFSSAATRRGLSATEIGNIFKRLMTRLGHEKFYVSGGDWGAVIISDMATLYPQSIIAAQSTMCFPLAPIGQIRYALATLFPSWLMPGGFDKGILPFLEYLKFLIRETGYGHLQMTKPDTVGVALTQSPLGLAAYILEKFSTWTNRTWTDREDGGLLQNFDMNELLDNVMIYWITGSITTSMRLYKEQMDPDKKHKTERVPTNVPFSCQFLPGDIAIFPEFALTYKYTNSQNSFTIADRGGHFGAFEVPQVVAENVLNHFEKF